MGDRFYQQQYNLKQGQGMPEVKAKKLSKAELAQNLGNPAYEKLLVKDLEKLALHTGRFTGELPEGRLKKPYIDAAKQINEEVDWSKLTVKELKEILA
jgi:hypothetical protein